KLETQAEEFRSAGLDVIALPFDQGDEADAQRLLDTVLSATDHVEILVNNAVARPMKDWSDPVSAWAESMQINATRLFAITRVFGNHMAAKGGGSIINIGSIQGLMGPDFTLYEGLNWGAPPDY